MRQMPFSVQDSILITQTVSLGLALLKLWDLPLTMKKERYNTRSTPHCCQESCLYEERNMLHDGLNTAQKDDITGENIAAAMIRAEHILKRWREEIEQAVREGEKYEEYANIFLPHAKTDSEKIALTLVHFRRIDYNNLPKVSVAQTKEKRGEDITRQIVASTQITQAIKVLAHLNHDSEETEHSSCANSSTSESICGTAVKSGSSTWTVILKNKQQMNITTDDLMDPSHFFVKRKLSTDNLTAQERKKQSAKQKRARRSEKIQKEQSIRERAMEEQRKFERKEYDDILNVIKAGNEYSFENFLAMVDRIRKPFTCFIEGHEVSITQDDAAIMMEKSVMKEITDSLFHASEKQPNSSVEEQAKKKQRQGTQAIHTENGANGITVLHQTIKRDEHQNQVTTKKRLTPSNMK